MRLSALLAVVVTAGSIATATPAVAAPAPTPGWPACTPRTAPIRTGVTQTARTTSGRVVTLTLRSQAMQGEQQVDVLLPAGYGAAGARRYPVLYLLHGAAGSYHDWVDHGAEAIVGDLPVIVVMPDGGPDGGYSDWTAVEPGRAPVPAYESYDIAELVPFVDAHFRTQPTTAGRAIAGLSMGGHGAMKYAAEYPGMFGYAGAFSGAVYPDLPLYQQLIKQCTWGDPAIDGVVWQDNDPTLLAANLRGVRLFVRSGDGHPGPYEAAGAPDDLVETVVGQMNTDFLAALRKAGVTGVDAHQGAGTHTWPYWQQDLREYVGWLRTQLERPPAAPATFAVRSAHAAFTAWGWSFRVRRSVREFLYVKRVAGKLTLTGSGRVTAVSPGGRRLAIDLGASHREQQTRFDAAATKGWRTVTVRVRR